MDREAKSRKGLSGILVPVQHRGVCLSIFLKEPRNIVEPLTETASYSSFTKHGQASNIIAFPSFRKRLGKWIVFALGALHQDRRNM